MNPPAAKLSVCVGDRCACVKVQGRATIASSIDFAAVVTRLQERGCTHFLIELSECSLMDSTFLGVLAGIGLKLPRNESDPDCPGLELHNANARITELLENIGVLHLFKTSAGSPISSEALEPCAELSARVSRADLTRTCLRAHELLMSLNSENVARFKDVTKYLAEELAHLEGKPPPKS